MNIKPSTQIEISARQELPYRCSACGADRGCNCNAPAVEKLKTIQENQRAASKAYRARQKAPASYDADIENTKESTEEAAVLAKYLPEGPPNPIERAWGRATEFERVEFARKHRNGGSAVVEKPNIPSRSQRKHTAALLRIVDLCLMTADLAPALLAELKEHGASDLVAELEHRLSLRRDESSAAATDNNRIN